MEPQELMLVNPNDLKFGDIVINHWASDRNPHRKGIVVRVDPKTVYCTDGKGEFWHLVKDSESKIVRVGSLIPSPTIPNT